MGEIFADIILYNGADFIASKMGTLSAEQIRQMEVNALVDSGATTLVINEKIKNQLGLILLETKEIRLVDGSIENYEFVVPVEIRFKNRRSLYQAIVLPNAEEVLLGTIPMEEMDVIIDMKNQELIVPPERPYIAGAKAK
ncbi:MAG: clan AA aspartic protease [Planctomycetaceae bacterium]|jgi:clan AA aspartic protease|nr:clan AA aspartic protease [Planctomycetaceae bacterium]